MRLPETGSGTGGPPPDPTLDESSGEYPWPR